MGIIQTRIEEVFEKFKRHGKIDVLIHGIIINLDYYWDWQRRIAREEISNQLSLLNKEGFRWQIVKR